MLKKLLTISLLLATMSMVADMVKMNDGKTLEGVFLKFHKDKLSFHPYSSKEPVELEFSHVVSLKLDKNAKGKALKNMASKQPVEITLRGYEDGKFAVIMDGKRQKVNSRAFDKIEVPFNLQDFYTRKKAFEEQQGEKEQEQLKPQKAEKMLVKGKATIIHFDDGSAPSIRQGNLCRQLSESSHGKLALIVIPVTDLAAPMATINDLKTTPQFWFFAANGKLIEKLSDRFAEEDIEKAATRARKGK